MISCFYVQYEQSVTDETNNGEFKTFTRAFSLNLVFR